MQLRKRHIIPCILAVLFAGPLFLGVPACKKIYNPPAIQVNPDFLVVDGVINSGPGTVTTFNLSRTLKLSDSAGAYTPELHAQITILSNAGDAYPLVEQGNGVYASPTLALKSSEKYQVSITTHNGSKYISDAVPVSTAAPIDSLTWLQDDSSGNVVVSVNTHDPTASSHYYRWFYSETWEYHAPLQSELGLDANGQIYYTIDSITQQFLIYYCWRSDNSTDILLGNTTALGQDRISQAPIAIIPRGDQRMSIRYSMLASQYVLTEPAYQYWLILQKNSQNLGTLFDPQPSQATGNYHCLTNPNEPVIGYLSASSITQLRMFIANNQLHNWDTVVTECPTKVTGQYPDFRIYTYPDTLWGPYYFSGPALILSKRLCLDCREQGGTLTKPSFW